jgi:endonuclease/exonuclease/phosphatase family metal-dependent hydrolase
MAAIPVVAAAVVAFGLHVTCRSAAAVQPKAGLRIVTYNIAWLDSEAAPERVANLQSVLRDLNADVIALQEVDDRAAAARVLGDEWEIAIADDASEAQEVALAVRKPLRVEKWQQIFRGPEFEHAFPGRREALSVTVSTPNGSRVIFIVVHMKSRGGGGRLQTDAARIAGCSLLAGYVAGLQEQFVCVLGDFNDTPDDQSVNILESGLMAARGGMEPGDGAFLVNVCEAIWAEDYVTLYLYERFRGDPLVPRVQGSRAENNKFRGREYRFPDDVAVKPIMFDQILVSPKLAKLQSGETNVYSGEAALRGTSSRVTRTESGRAQHELRGTLASDHLPVYADFRL